MDEDYIPDWYIEEEIKEIALRNVRRASEEILERISY